MDNPKHSKLAQDALTLAVRRGGFRTLEKAGLLSLRDIDFQISNADRAVANGTFVEWKSTGGIVDFFREADGIDGDEAAFAECCMSRWKGNPFRKGTLVHFKQLVSDAPANEVDPMWKLRLLGGMCG